jgi:hypothetical protein
MNPRKKKKNNHRRSKNKIIINYNLNDLLFLFRTKIVSDFES